MAAPGTSDWWASLVSNDPLFAYQQQQASADDLADQRARDQGITRQLIQYGDVAGALNSAKGLGLDFSQIATPETQAAAQALTNSGLSTYARNQLSDQDARRGITNTLAASGILNSGETGFRMGRQDLVNAQNQFGSIQSLLDYLQGAQQGYLDHQRSRQSSLFTAGQAAADRIAKLNAGAQTTPYYASGGDKQDPYDKQQASDIGVLGAAGASPNMVPFPGQSTVPAAQQTALGFPGSNVTAVAKAPVPTLAQVARAGASPGMVALPKVAQPTSYSPTKNQVKLAPGQTLHYATNRGYYSA